MAGRSGDKLAPEDTITTAEALVMLERAAGLPDVGQLRDDLETVSYTHLDVYKRQVSVQRSSARSAWANAASVSTVMLRSSIWFCPPLNQIFFILPNYAG